MQLQINRKYKLIIGDFESGNGLEITNLQVSFDVSKSSDNSQSSNSATIEIYNLSDESLKVLQTDYPAAVFYVGYGKQEDVKLLFAGEVVNISTKKNGADRVTQLQLGSGYVELNHTNISKTLPAGKTVEDAFNEIVKGFPNISRGTFNGSNLKSPLINGYSLSGTIKEQLDELSDTYGLEYRIDNNTLFVNDKGRGENENFNFAYVISPSSGLIEMPYYTSGDRRRKETDKIKKQGVQFSMLINPDVYAGKIIRLEDTNIIGWFKVDSVRYSGSWRNGNWLQEVLCSAIEKVDKK